MSVSQQMRLFWHVHTPAGAKGNGRVRYRCSGANNAGFGGADGGTMEGGWMRLACVLLCFASADGVGK